MKLVTKSYLKSQELKATLCTDGIYVPRLLQSQFPKHFDEYHDNNNTNSSSINITVTNKYVWEVIGKRSKQVNSVGKKKSSYH